MDTFVHSLNSITMKMIVDSKDGTQNIDTITSADIVAFKDGRDWYLLTNTGKIEGLKGDSTTVTLTGISFLWICATDSRRPRGCTTKAMTRIQAIKNAWYWGHEVFSFYTIKDFYNQVLKDIK